MARKAASRLKDDPRDRVAKPARKEWLEPDPGAIAERTPPRVPRSAPANVAPRVHAEAPRKVGARPPKRPARVVTPGPRVALPGRPAAIVELKKSMADAVGARQLPSALRRVEEAKRAYAAERFDDARRALAPLARDAAHVAEVRELYGLSLYRLRKWSAAIIELEAFRAIAGSPEQNPVLADAYRALRKWKDVDQLWEELREYSPSKDLVVEGRIVAAGALADQGKLAAAIELLEKGWDKPSRPEDHHFRRAYALADLYERSGAALRGRDLFRWIVHHDANFADAAIRASQLR